MSYYISFFPRYVLTAFFVSTLIFIAYIIISQTIFFNRNKRRKTPFLYYIPSYMLVFWCIIIFCVTLLDRHRRFDSLRALAGNYGIYDKTGQLNLEGMGNVLLFVPFGFFEYLLFVVIARNNGLPQVSYTKYIFLILITTGLFSIAIEGTQFLLSSGMVQLSDLFHNVVGALVGCLCFGFPVSHCIVNRSK